MRFSRKASLATVGVGSVDADTDADETVANSLGREGWRRIRSNKLAVIGGSIIVFFIFVAVFAPLLAPYGPRDNSWFDQIRPTSIPGPSREHWFGLDEAGRDEFSRIIFGARASLLIGVLSLMLGATVGAALGLLAGAFGGWVDSLVMRMTDVLRR